MGVDLGRPTWQDPFWKIYQHLEPGVEVIDERGRVTPLAPRTIVMLPSWQRWRIVSRRAVQHIHMVVDVPQLPASLVRRHFLGAWVMPDDRAWRARAASMAVFAGSVEPGQAPSLATSCAAQALCYRIFEDLLAPLERVAAVPAPVRAALARLDANLAGDCRTSLLAREAAVGIKGLNTAFRSALGVSAAEFVRERRIARAADLLLTSEWSIDRIAEESGFPNRHYLTRVFARRMGLPPAQYRAQRAVR